MTESKDMWKPVKKFYGGMVYCSPACGANCKLSAYEDAVKFSKELSDHLGDGWKPVVWENLGWHYRAVSSDGYVKVHPRKHDGWWTAYLGESSSGGIYVEACQTPDEAVAAVYAMLEEHIKGLEALRKDK